MNNVVTVSGIQKSDSATNIQVSILFQIIYLFKSYHNKTEQSSLCYTVGPHQPSL